MTLGRVFKEMENAALAWGTDGVELTDAETIANTNTTLVTSDTPWNVARHTYLLSVAATRLAFCAAYALVDFKRSITSPDQVRVLSLSPLAQGVTHLIATASASCSYRHDHRPCLVLAVPHPCRSAATTRCCCKPLSSNFHRLLFVWQVLDLTGLSPVLYRWVEVLVRRTKYGYTGDI